MIIKKPYVLERVEKLSPDIFRFRFRARDGAAVDFIPGMFAMLAYRDDKTGEEIARAYSISSVPNANYFDFIITMIHGQMTSKLEAAKPGDVYYISAPYGQFKIDADPSKKFLFLPGGSGLVPFLSAIEYVKSKGICIDARMVYSVRFPYEIICKDELQGLVDCAMLKLTVTVTRPKEGDGWTGQTGRIDAEMIRKYVPDLVERICYICGPMAFVNAVKAALAGLGVKDDAVKAEMWGE